VIFLSEVGYHTKYDLVNILTGKKRTISHREAVEWMGKDELLEHLETGWYGDNVIAPSIGARPIKG
jgi:hypothetical protein